MVICFRLGVQKKKYMNFLRFNNLVFMYNKSVGYSAIYRGDSPESEQIHTDTDCF